MKRFKMLRTTVIGTELTSNMVGYFITKCETKPVSDWFSVDRQIIHIVHYLKSIITCTSLKLRYYTIEFYLSF